MNLSSFQPSFLNFLTHFHLISLYVKTNSDWNTTVTWCKQWTIAWVIVMWYQELTKLIVLTREL